MQRLLPALHEKQLDLLQLCSPSPGRQAGREGWTQGGMEGWRQRGMEAGRDGGIEARREAWSQAGRDGGRRAESEGGLPVAGAQLCHCQHCRALHRSSLALPAEKSHNSRPLIESPS